MVCNPTDIPINVAIRQDDVGAFGGVTTTQPRQRYLSQVRTRPTREQLAWIETRDAVGEIINRYLAAHPEPRERLAIALVEDSLRAGDRAVGLL